MTPRGFVALVVVAGGAVAVIVGARHTDPAKTSTPTPSLSAPACTAGDANLPLPSWFPKDLPMPQGTVFRKETSTATGSSGVFTVPGTLDAFVRATLKDWPAARWHLGRGDREALEAEDSFSKGTVAGYFRAIVVSCEPQHIEVLMSFSRQG